MDSNVKKVRSFRLSDWQYERLKKKYLERNTGNWRGQKPTFQNMLDEAITVYIMTELK